MAKFSEKEPEAKKDIDPFYWYTEDNIRDLLSLIPPESARVFAQTQLEHVDLLQASFRTATLQVIADGTPALIPIHLNGNHWAGAIVRRQADGKVQVIYNDPRGDALETHENVDKLVAAVREIAPDCNIVDLKIRQQQNSNDCGPFTVDNLYRLFARRSELDNLTRDQIQEKGILLIPENGDATNIRREQAKIVPELLVDVEEMDQEKASGVGIDGDVVPANRRLDSIARLIAGGDTCTAVCFDGKNLLVANNNNTNPCISSYFTFFRDVLQLKLTLKQMASDQALNAKMNDLVELSIEQYLQQPQYRDIDLRLQTIDKIIRGEINPEERNAFVAREISILQENLDKPAIANNKKVKVGIQSRLELIQDAAADPVALVNAMAEHRKVLLTRYPSEEEIAEMRYRLRRDVEKVISSLATDSDAKKRFTEGIREAIGRVGGAKILIVHGEPKGLHAEMVILDSIINRDGSVNVVDREVKEGRKVLYPGVSKLCCLDCHQAIEAFNRAHESKARVIEVVGESEVKAHFATRGTHLKSYSGWIAPKFIEIPDVAENLAKIKTTPAVYRRRAEEADLSVSDSEITKYSPALRRQAKEIFAKTSQAFQKGAEKFSGSNAGGKKSEDTEIGRKRPMLTDQAKEIKKGLERAMAGESSGYNADDEKLEGAEQGQGRKRQKKEKPRKDR